MKLLLVALPCVSGFFLGLRPAPAPSAQCHVRMMDSEATRDSEGSYEEYIADRASGKTAGGSIEESAEGYAEFEKYNLDFDGGDSGGGVVGDGNTDLEDQHNSASIVRGGFGAASVGGGGVNVGRGTVVSATDSKIASAGKNYFGRSTGYADKKLDELAEEQEKLQASGQSAKADLARHTMDCVRAQQMENWHNQRGIAKENRAAGQGVVYGAPSSRAASTRKRPSAPTRGAAARWRAWSSISASWPTTWMPCARRRPPGWTASPGRRRPLWAPRRRRRRRCARLWAAWTWRTSWSRTR